MICISGVFIFICQLCATQCSGRLQANMIGLIRNATRWKKGHYNPNVMTCIEDSARHRSKLKSLIFAVGRGADVGTTCFSAAGVQVVAISILKLQAAHKSTQTISWQAGRRRSVRGSASARVARPDARPDSAPQSARWRRGDAAVRVFPVTVPLERNHSVGGYFKFSTDWYTDLIDRGS